MRSRPQLPRHALSPRVRQPAIGNAAVGRRRQHVAQGRQTARRAAPRSVGSLPLWESPVGGPLPWGRSRPGKRFIGRAAEPLGSPADTTCTRQHPIAPTAAPHTGSDNGSNLIGWRAGGGARAQQWSSAPVSQGPLRPAPGCRCGWPVCACEPAESVERAARPDPAHRPDRPDHPITAAVNSVIARHPWRVSLLGHRGIIAERTAARPAHGRPRRTGRWTSSVQGPPLSAGDYGSLRGSGSQQAWDDDPEVSDTAAGTGVVVR